MSVSEKTIIAMFDVLAQDLKQKTEALDRISTLPCKRYVARPETSPPEDVICPRCEDVICPHCIAYKTLIECKKLYE